MANEETWANDADRLKVELVVSQRTADGEWREVSKTLRQGYFELTTEHDESGGFRAVLTYPAAAKVR